MRHCERVVRGNVASRHIVQLFDTSESLADTVAEFLHEGWERGEQLLVVVTPAHWRLMITRLASRGCPVQEATDSGRLVVSDAERMLKKIMRNDVLDPPRFEAVVGALVNQLASPPARGLRIYGEMVNILARDANFDGAYALERLWNQLGERVPLTLFCGYAAAHFGDPRAAQVVQAICNAHTHVRSKSEDDLGAFLVARAQASGGTSSFLLQH
jgi:hypothetical protein